MKEKNIQLLHKIIADKSKEWNFEIMKPEHSGTVISILQEDWHLFIKMHSPIVYSLPLQMSICVEGKAVRALIFPSPIIINSGNVSQFVRLSNVANHQYLCRGNALGRFWADEESCDLAYELILDEYLIEHYTEDIGRQLFDIPFNFFKDAHIPLVELAGNIWKADTAISYLEELWGNGYVDNSDYNLW